MNTIEETRLDMQLAFQAMARDKLLKLDAMSATMREDDLLHACVDLADMLIDEAESALNRIAKIACDGASFNAGQREWGSHIDDYLSGLHADVVDYTRDKLMDYDADEVARGIDADRRVDAIREAAE